MSPEELKACGRRVTEELFNQGDQAVADRLLGPDYTDYIVADGTALSAMQLRDLVVRLRAAFPDLRSQIEEQIVEGDILVQRLTVTGTHRGAAFNGVPTSGRRVRISAVSIARMGPDGRFAEQWTLHDRHAVLAQLGVEPS
ncbi:ester cyclase [Actinokineospora sp. HUAS TT18]|uniref:ester cyclase n=1 Tax=Actinokineospora sp. HUAS TT18 TaxID=3447451 RepID=UPI003F52228F